MKFFKNLRLTFGGLMLAALAACGGGSSGPVAESGTLRLALTDAPSCGYDNVFITIEKVRAHQLSTASDTDGGWIDVGPDSPKRIDLLKLNNGGLFEIGKVPLPIGRYTQLRMILAENTSTTPFANSVVISGTPPLQVALKTPSGQQLGVKANISIDVPTNRTVDFVIDFNACKSIVSAGSSGQYLLKPVVTVIPLTSAGVQGYVDTALVNTQVVGSTSVSLQRGGAVIKATTPDSTGKFLLQPVIPGSYTLVLSAAGRVTSVITNVVVAADTVTLVNTNTLVLNPPTSATGTVKGIASLGTLVTANQLLTAGPNIEVASRYVDGFSAYSYALPMAAPSVAPYVALPGTLVFAPDTAVAGKYTLRASLDGFADKTAVLPTLTTSSSPITTDFTFQ